MTSRARVLPPLVLVLLTVFAQAQTIDLEPPGERDFILDRAGMVRPEHAVSIRTICDALLDDQAIPIIVVTIESMAKYGGGEMSVENFAYELFNQWEIGYESVNGAAWNRGMLLLIARDDREARIELGASWGREFDPWTQRIMDEQIIPNFRDGKFSEGILAGVNALDKLGRHEPMPKPVESSSSSGAMGGAQSLGSRVLNVILFPFILIVAFIRSLFRRRRGFGPSYGRGYGGRGSSGGFRGGSFGGGFSGRGGATGRW